LETWLIPVVFVRINGTDEYCPPLIRYKCNEIITIPAGRGCPREKRQAASMWGDTSVSLRMFPT